MVVASGPGLFAITLRCIMTESIIYALEVSSNQQCLKGIALLLQVVGNAYSPAPCSWTVVLMGPDGVQS
jgi:hypothetical protein